MKIMHVVESYGGGVFTSVNQLCNGFAKKHDVILVHGLRDETPANFDKALFPEVRRIQIPFTREIRPGVDWRSLKALVALLRSERPDVVHLHSSKAGFLGRLAAAIVGRRAVVYSPRAFAFLDPNTSAKKKLLYTVLEKVADKLGGVVVGCSKDEAAEARGVATRVTQINNAIDIAFLDRIAKQAGAAPPRPLTVGVHARVRDAKRPGLFLDVARQVQAVRPDVRFLWVGGGDPFFESTPEVACTGWLSREEALTAVAREIDIYLLTSAYEGLPLSVIEAAALGKPAVCTAVSGTCSAVVNGRTGLLCSDRGIEAVSAAALSAAVLELVNSPERRRTMGAAAREHAVAEFDLPLMLTRYQVLYESLTVGAAQKVAHAV